METRPKIKKYKPMPITGFFDGVAAFILLVSVFFLFFGYKKSPLGLAGTIYASFTGILASLFMFYITIKPKNIPLYL